MRVRLRLPLVSNPEGGIALIIVLLVLSMLLALVGEFALAMRLEATTTLNFRGAVAGAYLAEAAYHRAMAEIIPEAVAHHFDEDGRLVFRRDLLEVIEVPTREEIVLGPGRFAYRITDEEARLNLNRATPQIFGRLLAEVGVDQQTREVIVDSLLDWRDANELHRLKGAESDDYYLTLPVPYRSKNANLDSVDELLQVRGVTPEILYGRPDSPGLADYLTVAGSGAINVNTAEPTVLRALGFAEAEVEVLVAGRPYLNLAGLPTQFRRGNQRTRSQTFRIEARGELPGLGPRILVAVVQRKVGRDGLVGVTPLSWRWNPDEVRP